MKVLIVCSGNFGKIIPFIKEQAESIEKKGVEIDYYLIKGNGFLGYIFNYSNYRQKISQFNPDIIHAHYGLSGLLANFQRKIPVITTYHGSDINNLYPYMFSKITILLSSFNIIVSRILAIKAKVSKKYLILSCGVNIEDLSFMDRYKARQELKMETKRNYVLFSSSFSNKVKNYALAADAIELVKNRGIDVELLELKGYNRKQVGLLMNAVDCVLVTSFKESGPLVIKEAMAVNTCAVSLDVGDVKEVTNGTNGYFIATNKPEDVAKNIRMALKYGKRTNGRERIIALGLDSVTVAKGIIEIYKKVLRK
jgi:teichuronic acid biosynthesis glycosyltransferase TuaC